MIAALVLSVLSEVQAAVPKAELTALRRCLARFWAPDPRTGQVDASDDRRMLISCFPYRPPERISGVWVTGFEQNYFIEGAIALPPRWRAGLGGTGTVELSVSRERMRQLYDLQHGDRRVFRVTFVDRHPLSTAAVSYGNPIVVEHFISIQRVGTP